MADNTQVAVGYGDTIATDEISGVKYQRVKLIHGADGTNSGDVSTANPYPVRLLAEQNNGLYKAIHATTEGHLEVDVHGPRLPFGSVHAESLSPVFQVDGVYGVNSYMATTTTGLSVGTGSGSGSVTASGNKFVCSTGTTQYSFATVQSRRRLRYRPGQGVVGRFTALWSTPAASSIVVAGIGTAEAGIYFGYNGTSFGILHSTGGVREIHTLTITTASTSTNAYVVTLPNGATVNVAATSNSSTARTAYEISQGTFPGWDAEARGATVVFVRGSAGPVTGTFSLAQTGAVTPAAGTDAETVAGVAATDVWIPQASWNGDVMDGSDSASNPSGFSFDPTKGNLFEIGVSYLGYGAVTCKVAATFDDANQPEYVTVHTFKFPNTRTAVNLSQPAFPFTAAAYSAGSTTDVTVSVGSFAGFIEGQIKNLGPRQTYFNTAAVTSSVSAYVPIFTARNSLYYAGRANQAVSHLLSVAGAAKSNAGLTTFILIRNATLTGNASFTQFSDTSVTYWDTASTGCSFANNSQIIWSGSVSESGQFNALFDDREITLQPGETVTLAVRSVSQVATCIGSLNTREDQ